MKTTGEIERHGVEQGIEWWVVALRGIGHRCGYVELPEDHPWRKASSESSDLIPDEAHRAAHGGLTWLGTGSRVLPGRFLAGFDAAHLGDRPDPELMDAARLAVLGDSYAPTGSVRSADYMEQSAKALARVVAS